MTAHFIPPWPDVGRYPADFIERHSARCRVLDVLDETLPRDVAEMLRGAPQDVQDAARAAANDATIKLADMTAWLPKDYVKPDMRSVRARLLAGGFSHACLWGGRGGGKSYIVADVIVELASTVKERVVCCREFQNSIADSAHSLLKGMILASRWARDWTITETEMRNERTGSRITFIGLARNPQAMKSLDGATITWVEEASQATQVSIDLLTPTVMRSSNSRIFWTYNPDEVTTPVDEMFRSGEKPERSVVFSIDAQDNAWFYTAKMPGERRTAFAKMSKEKFRHIWAGGYNISPGDMIFTEWSVGRIAVPDDLAPRYGLDWGFEHPFCCIEAFIIEPDDPESERGKIYISAEVHKQGLPARKIAGEIDAAMPMARSHVITADSSEPKSIDDLENEGFRVVGARKGPGSVRAGIALIQSYDVVIAPDCVGTIADFGAYRKKKTKTGAVLHEPNPIDDEAPDCLRYLLEDYTPPPRRGKGGVVYV